MNCPDSLAGNKRTRFLICLPPIPERRCKCTERFLISKENQEKKTSRRPFAALMSWRINAIWKNAKSLSLSQNATYPAKYQTKSDMKVNFSLSFTFISGVPLKTNSVTMHGQSRDDAWPQSWRCMATSVTMFGQRCDDVWWRLRRSMARVATKHRYCRSAPVSLEWRTCATLAAHLCHLSSTPVLLE